MIGRFEVVDAPAVSSRQLSYCQIESACRTEEAEYTSPVFLMEWSSISRSIDTQNRLKYSRLWNVFVDWVLGSYGDESFLIKLHTC